MLRVKKVHLDQLDLLALLGPIYPQEVQVLVLRVKRCTWIYVHQLGPTDLRVALVELHLRDQQDLQYQQDLQEVQVLVLRVKKVHLDLRDQLTNRTNWTNRTNRPTGPANTTQANAVKVNTSTENEYHNITFVPKDTTNNSYQTLEIDFNRSETCLGTFQLIH